MMDPTPRNLPEEERHYWERLYEGALIEFLKRGQTPGDAARNAAYAADKSIEIHAERFAKK
jgi:hypothetical protein